MSTTTTSDGDPGPQRPKHYAPGTGTDRYVRFARDWLDVELAEAQQRILRALAEHRRTVVVTGNGLGKSYGGGAVGGIAATYCNPDTTTNITSGSYGQLDDTIWKPIKSLHRHAAERYDLPGRTLDNTRELRTELDEEWYLKCLSPKYPADLEGRHNRRMIYIIEEADKPGITAEHIDSAESTLTDADDRMLVIANPPTDETNVVHDLMRSDDWHTIQLASWDSRNVRVDIGEHEGPKLPGLVELSEVRENWEDWNGEPWPGIDTARVAHEHRDDLDQRWYRRRAGVMPRAGAGVWRPIEATTASEAYERPVGQVRETPSSAGVDVARKHDRTVLYGVHGPELRCHYDEQGAHFEEQGPALTKTVRAWPSPTVAVDFGGPGAGIHDRLDQATPNVVEFNNGATAADDTTYRTKWAEGLALLGEFLADGGSFTNSRLREELLVAARVIEFEETHLSSRGGEVIEATPKDAIKQRLGRSPDHLDAALMAVWAEEADESDGRASPTWSF